MCRKNIDISGIFGNTYFGAILSTTLSNRFISALKYLTHLVREALTIYIASRLVQNGVDLFRVSKLLGHSSIKVTEKYNHDLSRFVHICPFRYTYREKYPQTKSP